MNSLVDSFIPKNTKPRNSTPSTTAPTPNLDPFSITPSVLSPARSTEPLRPLSPLIAHTKLERPEEEIRNPLGDSKSPFHDEPIDSIQFASTGNHSRGGRLSSPPLNSNRRRGNGGNLINSTMTVGGSSGAIGNASLMGLLGGTRFGIGAFEANALREEEEFAEQVGGGGFTESEKFNLANSLPPPPSRIDANSEQPREEEEEDDPPPDFTSRASTQRSKRRTNSRNSTKRSNHNRKDASDGWGGLRLGGRGPIGILGSQRSSGMGAKDRALWRWINVEDLDSFLQEVYVYYVGKGIWAIGLSRLLNLLTVGWVIFFSTFLMGCIDYSVLWQSHHLSEVVVDRCVSRFSGLTLILVLSFASFYFWRVIRFGMGVRKLWEMHEFFAELLEVPEDDIQTIPWHAIVSHLSVLRSTHPSALSSLRSAPSASVRPTPTLDAHDVANRIMREENYLIALFNKDVVDLSVPIPEHWRKFISSGKGGLLTRTLEWNLSFCLLGYLFGKDGQVRRIFLSERNRKELVAGLRRRFMLMGLINAIFAPFIILYLLMYTFFRYFEEYHKNPSSIGSRQFTQLARWKFREFNELPHLFSQRMNYAHPIAAQYVNQFPKEKTALASRFVAFLAGSFAAVLILFSIIDPDAFLHFEITPGRTVLFYIGVFGTILAVARGMVPDENKVVDPEEVMKEIVEFTHYLPLEWRDKLHSAEVHKSFGLLFQMKVSLFFQEILSVIVTPFILWYTLPDCSPAIVDFFREFTVHVDGLGYVCSFAVFDFKRHGDVRFGAPQAKVEEKFKSNDGKMEKSFLNFTAHYPDYIPRSDSQSLFLSKMTEAPTPLPSQPHRFKPTPNRQRGVGGAASFMKGKSLIISRDIEPLEEEPIEENSALDGDSFIAPTTSQPFGNGLVEGEEKLESSGDNGVLGLLGEAVMKQW